MDELLRNIFTVNLAVEKTEKVLVFNDLIRASETPSSSDRKRREALPGIARRAAEAGKALCDTVHMEFPATGTHGAEPPEELWAMAFGMDLTKELKSRGLLSRVMEKKADARDVVECEDIIKGYAGRKRPVDAVMALSNFSTSHTRFRKWLTLLFGARYASMPLFDEAMFHTAMTADWLKVKERTLDVISKVSGVTTVNINTPIGTSISFSVKGRTFQPDTGILSEPGSFGNLPAGEVFVAPVEGTAKGVLVLEWAPTRKLNGNVILTVEDGVVKNIEGSDGFAEELRNAVKKEPLAANIAELGIGTNNKAVRPDNILETEKILGTVHIAIGDNASFGGAVSVPFHQDFIFFKPTVTLDNTTLLLDEGIPLF